MCDICEQGLAVYKCSTSNCKKVLCRSCISLDRDGTPYCPVCKRDVKEVEIEEIELVGDSPAQSDERVADEAAIYLEECHISGDAMIAMDHGLDDLPEAEQGSLYLHDLMAGFAQREHVTQAQVKGERARTALAEIDSYNRIGNDLDAYLGLLAEWGLGNRDVKPNPQDFGLTTKLLDVTKTCFTRPGKR